MAISQHKHHELWGSGGKPLENLHWRWKPSTITRQQWHSTQEFSYLPHWDDPRRPGLAFPNSLLTSEIDLLHYLSYTILLHTLSLSLSHNHSSNILFWLKSLSGDSLAAAVKNPSCNARDRHGFHPWSGKIPRAVELLSPGATTTETEHPGARALRREKPAPWEVCAPQWRVAPTLCN